MLALSPDLPSSDVRDDDAEALGRVTEFGFSEALGPAGRELLEAGLRGAVADVAAIRPFFSSMAVGSQ
jgi:hypothetical protein